MKNVFFALAFMLIGTSAFANDSKKVEAVKFEKAVELLNSSTYYQIIDNNSFSEKSCTIKTGHQIINNGEVVYQETNSWTITGMSCDEFFFYLSLI